MAQYNTTTVINIRQPNQEQPTKIQQVPTEEERRTLGVRLCPLGSLDEELNHLVAKAQHISVGFCRRFLTPQEWIRAYQMICLPRLTYSLLIMYFSKADLKKVQAKFMTAALHAYHCHGKFPHVVAFAPMSVGRLRFLHLFYLQSINQVKLFIGLARTESELSYLFKIDLEYFWLIAGTGECLF